MFMTLGLLLLAPLRSYAQIEEFDLVSQSKKHGSTIYTRWKNWIERHYTKSGNNYNYYRVQTYKGENGFRGWNIDGTDGRPTTWYFQNNCGPGINNNTWYGGEDLRYWYHFKYENINEITPDHPYIEIWLPTWDKDSQSNSDGTKANALYVTDADGDDVLVGVTQRGWRQIDNYLCSPPDSYWEGYGELLSAEKTVQDIEQAYNSGNYLDMDYPSIQPGLLANPDAKSYGESPEYVKLRYYPGYNMGEKFDMSFIVNWDLNSENNDRSTDTEYINRYPVYATIGRAWYKPWDINEKFPGEVVWTWSTDWANMFVTRGIRINNKVAAPTAERLRGGRIKLSASGVKTYTDFQTFFVVENVGRLNLGHTASGSTTMGSNLDFKQPLRNYSVVMRHASIKNGSLEMGGNAYYPSWQYEGTYSSYSSTNRMEPLVQEFKNYHPDIPGCMYATDVQVAFDKWNKKTVISWSLPDDKDKRYKEGKFYVFRYEPGSNSYTVVGDAEVNGSLVVEDPDVEYGKNYIYKVSFLMNNWLASDGPEPSLTTEAEVISTTAEYEYSAATAASKENSVLLSWTHDTPKNSTPLSFKVWRVRDNSTFYDEDGKADHKKVTEAFPTEPYAENISPASSGSTTTYEDRNLESKCAAYWYRISADILGGTFYSPLIGPVTMSGNTEIKDVTANRGTYSNVVKVQWDVKQVGTDPTRFVVYRRLLGSDKEEDYQKIHVTSGTESNYYFEDNTAQPGQFYQYKVVAQNNCVDPVTNETSFIYASSGEADGFCQSRGIISGRITYGTGTAVPNARVLLAKNNESGENTRQFYSMKVDPQGGILWTPAEASGKSLFNKGNPFTFQLYVNPEAVVADGSTIIDGGGCFGLQLKPAAVADSSQICLQLGSAEPSATGVTVANDDFTNISVTYDGNTGWTVRAIDKEGNLQSQSLTTDPLSWTGGEGVAFGCDRNFTSEHSFTGYLDDIRLWSKALTDDELLGNYDRLLIGTEPGLKLYWPMDEGLKTLPYAYDYSKTSGVANENHGLKKSNTAFSTIVPNEKQLNLYGVTDTEGNYVIRGIPFTGDGTNYKVSPDLGEHSFSPQYQTRFISNSALTHSGVDFEDISSFKMTGHVYYENTNIPVEGAYLYVDGTICAKDGEPLLTDENGRYEISVPIGDHYVQVKKDGHTFANNGRFPKDPNNTGTVYTFVKEETATFYDNTKVMIAGRVVGGHIENDKPLGFGQSKANIGQAKIVLSTRSNARYLNYICNVEKGTSALGENSLSFTGKYGTASVPGTKEQNGAQHLMTITTDALTGEFAIMVPPLDYAVESISIPSHEGYTFTSLPGIDATEVLNVRTDSCEVDGTMQGFDYVASMKMAYTNGATMTVTDLGNADGALGESVVMGKDDNEVEHTLDAYTVDTATGAVTYTQGAPLLLQNKPYKYKISAYQEYVNYDGGKGNEVVDRMPMAGSVITIANDYAMGAPICISGDAAKVGMSARELEMANVELNDDELQMDEKGQVIYQFTAGLPKTVSPYTRGCTIVMNDDASAKWQNSAIILGKLPKGNDFVTGGPDKVTMVLRDPGGSNSFATYGVGTTTSHTTTHTFNNTLSENVEAEFSTGTTQTFVAGSMVFAKETTVEVEAKVTAGAEISETFNYDGSSTTTTTTTEEISTSSNWDWTGAQADVFIGTGTNYIIGDATRLGFTFGTDGKATLGTKNVLSVSQGFTTAFNYTQNTIENIMIPNLLKLRNKFIQPKGSNLTAAADKAKYESLVEENDENFGKDGSYKMIDPTAPTEAYIDSVSYYNMQIDAWVQHLANNEKAKLKAIGNRDKWLVQNKSIDGGSSYTATVTNDTVNTDTYGSTTQLKMKYKVVGGAKFDGIGLSATSETLNTSCYQYTTGSTEASSQTISYTLAEDGDDDALTIDVFKAPDGLGPIFVTKGGRTSAPYEGQEVTKYYNPGTEISAATLQIEKPELSVRNPILQNVPSGRSAIFTLELTNNSDTEEDCWFNLGVCDATNTGHASFWVSGTPLGNGRQVFVPGGETVTMSLEMKQTDESVLDYKNIGIRLYSTTQKDNTGIHHEIADTVYVSATYVPAGPAVELALSHSVLNINAGTDLTLTASGYDLNYAKLTGLLMEYRKEGDNQWNKVQEYVKDKAAAAADVNLKELDGASEAYTFNMKALPDGNYIFRARTVCDFAGKTVYGNSEEVRLVKDQSAPKLFGTANPSDGILNADDEIGVTFNEDIVSADLSQSNFVIRAAVNGQKVDHAVALKAQNTERAAYTEANINLAKKDFSADMWVNYSTAGTLLSHGNGEEKFEVGTDAGGHLTLKIGGNTYTSAKTLTRNKWVFLTFNYAYNGEQSKFNALFAEDAKDTQLFNDQTVAGYNGNGALTLGKNITADIQELTLWDKARSCTEAKSEKDMTKKPSTPNLIGYWKMDEGDGKEIRDYARNRHLTMPQSTWYLNNRNISAKLDGKKAMKLDISACSALTTDDYAVELWFKSQQTGKATLFSAIEGADERVEMGFNNSGALTLTSKGAENEITTANLRDNAWHHLALNVLRNGNATVYVDGKAVKQMTASVVSALAGANLIVGAKAQSGNSYTDYFNGSVDEVRFWKATLSGDYIQRYRNVRLSGDEAGLVAYYPFEAQYFNDFQQSVVDETAADQSMLFNATTKEYEKTGRTATMTGSQVVFNETDVPGLKPAPQLTNLKYTFVANERGISIRLDEDADVLEGTTVDFTVRYATDKNYNMQSDINWTAYVRQNQLLWKGDSEVSLEKMAGEAATFEATIVNESGASENWTLEGLPKWLTASATGGTLKATMSKTITFNVAESLATGKYEQTVYLTGNNRISEPLTLSLKVKSKAPDWAVNPKDYENSMNVIGRVELNNLPMDDEDDIIAAFIGEECRGVAHPVYKERYDGNFITMDIYGNNSRNNSDAGKEITFRAFDASTGALYPVVTPEKSIRYTPLNLQGSYKEPVVFTVEDLVEQSTELQKGWNWLSVYVSPENSTVPAVFEKIADKVISVKSQADGWLMYENGSWEGNLNGDLSNTQMYAVQMKDDCTLRIVGRLVDPATTVTVEDGWNWIGYYGLKMAGLTDALADYEPEDGDILKGQSGVAYYDTYQWEGSLPMLEPGLGYMLNASGTKRFSYPSSVVTRFTKAYRFEDMDEVTTTEEESAFSPVSFRKYPYNAMMSVKLLNGGITMPDTEVGVYAGNECRAKARTNAKGVAYLTVPGEDETVLTFKVAAGSQIADAPTVVTFQPDGVYGTPKNPLIVDIDEATSMSEELRGKSEESVYDLSGRMVNAKHSTLNSQLKKGIYIINGQKKAVR